MSLPLTHRNEGRQGMVAAGLALAGVGVLTGRPGLLLASTVPVVLAAHARAATFPSPDLAVERAVSTTTPDREEAVEVTVTVTNEGASTAPDLRFIDGVPTALTVADGTPRHATALRPGESTSFSYAVTAERGHHTFDPLYVVAHDTSGGAARHSEVAVETELECVPPIPPAATLPLRPSAAGITGETVTPEGGAGVAFHTIREYRRGDPLNRIDWHRAARTGDLSTVEYQRERSATVVVVLDAREEGYVASDEHDRTVLERSVEAAGAVYEGRRLVGDRVGVATLSPADCWLAPGTGSGHRARVRSLLATHEALHPLPSDDPFFGVISLSRLRRRLPSDAQVVFCSPLVDDYAARTARRLDAASHPVTVVSPDPTVGTTTGQRLARVERSLRCSTLREAGIPVVDWGDETFQSTVANAVRRWSA
ncbi:DUF58 domain-containing protein [Halomarina oriensis]|uniref:DUF58 domain-containing protein n=1 Tax=Halomarina oriensis TaxID=671145 RepID=A0A6B0GQ08_9EURY|nr:DUF58 domain-containing protein [Halomarina oriensis]MWG36932.1 DUF58 domain-containing protein [Halomarina oriensis]